MSIRRIVASLVSVAVLLSLPALSQALSPALQQRFENQVREYAAEDLSRPRAPQPRRISDPRRAHTALPGKTEVRQRMNMHPFCVTGPPVGRSQPH
jgi:hypothetical protein